MLEDKIEKLTAAVENLTKLIEGMGQPSSVGVNDLVPPKKTRKKAADAPETKEENEIEDPDAPKTKTSEAPDAVASVSKNDLKELALDIVRRDPSAKPKILEILAQNDSKTITNLSEDPAILFTVFTHFNAISKQIG
jgi:hypothetical protein